MNTPLQTPLSIAGVYTQVLTPHSDSRGFLVEVDRAAWHPDSHFVQWNYTESNADTLRGVHVHVRHTDYVVALHGSLFVGLQDLRTYSPTYQQTTSITLTNPDQALVIPPGVAHGFYFSENTSLLVAMNEYFDDDDEFGCQWQDPQILIPWPAATPIVSIRDAQLSDFDTLMTTITPLLDRARVS